MQSSVKGCTYANRALKRGISACVVPLVISSACWRVTGLRNFLVGAVSPITKFPPRKKRLAGKYLSLDLLTIFNFISPGTSLISTALVPIHILATILKQAKINDLAVFNLYMFFLSPFNTSFRPKKKG